MERINSMGALAYVLGISLAGASGVSAAATTCNTDFTDVTINDNLTVPAGPTCGLHGVTVNGSVQVLAGGDLSANDSTYTGHHTVINGPLVATNSFQVFLKNVTVTGNATVNGGDSNGTMGNTFFGGSVSMRNIPTQSGAFIEFSGNHVVGSVILTDSPGDGGIFSNQVGGTVSVQRNTGNTYVSKNTIKGSLLCSANSPPPVSLGTNTVSGAKTGQCAGSLF